MCVSDSSVVLVIQPVFLRTCVGLITAGLCQLAFFGSSSRRHNKPRRERVCEVCHQPFVNSSDVPAERQSQKKKGGGRADACLSPPKHTRPLSHVQAARRPSCSLLRFVSSAQDKAVTPVSKYCVGQQGEDFQIYTLTSKERNRETTRESRKEKLSTLRAI